MGIRIPTVFEENDAKRCAGCGEPISGDAVPGLDHGRRVARGAAHRGPSARPSTPARTSSTPTLRTSEPGRAQRGYYLCRLSDVRELMRPVPLPIEPPAWGVCDARHHEAHEFLPGLSAGAASRDVHGNRPSRRVTDPDPR